MRKVLAFVVLAALAGSMPVARAAAPSNDNFSQATTIAAVPFAEVTDVKEATNEVLEPMPCAPTTHTVWYSFTAGSGGNLIADTFGSDFDTVLSVYTGDSLAALQDIACNDDIFEPGSVSRVQFSAEAGQTYYFQAGGWVAESGVLSFNLALPGAISGTITNESAEPLASICVVVEPGPDQPWSFHEGTTNGNGAYEVGELPPGDYVVSFFDCMDGTYSWEYYNDKLDYDLADLVSVASGATTSGIDAVLQKGPPPITLPPTNLAITSLSVENVPLQTDYGAAGYTGWTRRVHVGAANLSDVPAGALIEARACPVTYGRCTYLGTVFWDGAANSSTEALFKWNGLGSVGDFVITAKVSSPCQEDTNYADNEMTIDHYVIVGGTGVGVTPRQTGPGPYGFPWNFPTVYGCHVVVVIAEPVGA